jgi:hypothetical protein
MHKSGFEALNSNKHTQVFSRLGCVCDLQLLRNIDTLFIKVYPGKFASSEPCIKASTIGKIIKIIAGKNIAGECLARI